MSNDVHESEGNGVGRNIFNSGGIVVNIFQKPTVGNCLIRVSCCHFPRNNSNKTTKKEMNKGPFLQKICAKITADQASVG